MKIPLFLLLGLVCANLCAQPDSKLHGSLEVQGILTTTGQTPAGSKPTNTAASPFRAPAARPQ
jgi:hypothetical protein